jgi:hypothetical protein
VYDQLINIARQDGTKMRMCVCVCVCVYVCVTLIMHVYIKVMEPWTH